MKPPSITGAHTAQSGIKECRNVQRLHKASKFDLMRPWFGVKIKLIFFKDKVWITLHYVLHYCQ